MTNLARFTIAGTPSSQGGYDVAPGATPALALEASSSLVGRVTFECVTGTTGAPALTLDNGVTTGASVDAVTPSSSVTISAGIPAARTPHLWHIRCKVNGGTNSDGSVNPDYVFSRFVAMRSVNGLRKIMYGERGEYDPTESWAGAYNEGAVASSYNSELVIPIAAFIGGSDWSTAWGGNLMSLYQVTLGQNPAQAEISHLLCNGIPITGIAATLKGRATRSDVPDDRPAVALYRCSATDVDIGSATTLIHSADDASVLGTYVVSHEISASGAAHTVDLAAYRYFVNLYGEDGVNSVAGLQVSRIKLLRS